jgi:hypothetical protein
VRTLATGGEDGEVVLWVMSEPLAGDRPANGAAQRFAQRLDVLLVGLPFRPRAVSGAIRQGRDELLSSREERVGERNR